MIDIHAHIQKRDGSYPVYEILADMDRFHIHKRIISDMRVDNIQEGNTGIANIVKLFPERFIGCAVLNPALSTVLDDVDHLMSMPEIKMIEFNSYEHGYAPDSCPVLYSIFDKIKEKNITVKLFSGIGAKALPHQWITYLEKYPEIRFIFLHMRCFDYGYSCVDIVAKNKNAFLETSNQYEMQILRKAFTNLTCDKILFGTSYPERFTRNAIEVFDLFDLSQAQLQAITHDNAETLCK